MTELSVGVLLWLSTLFGVREFPADLSPWKIEQSWQADSNGNFVSVLRANVSEIGCGPQKYLTFPPIIHAAHKIAVDNGIIGTFGDPNMGWMRSFYGAPFVDCNLVRGESLTWTVVSSSRYFSRLSYWPHAIQTPNPAPQGETLLIAAAGALLILGVYLVWLTNKTELARVTSTLAIFTFSSGLFFVFATAGLFGFSISMRESHRWADFFLGVASLGFIFFLYLRNLVGKKLLLFGILSSVLTQSIILFAKNSDEIQLGTSISFLLAGAVFTNAVAKQIRQFPGPTLSAWFQNFFGLAFFVTSSLADIVYTLGAHTYGMSLPIGIVGCAYLLAIAVQTEIKKTYDERDFLRENLEKEVELKTKQLRESEFDLKKTLIDLKHTQAELVQSAKMASLGTLSAGIAHEINNSLNFVNGALPPLKKLGEKLATEKEKSLFNRLLEALQDGVHLTLEIVTSLRDYSGLNHSSVKDLHVLEVLNSVITILKGRIQGDVKVVVNVPADIYVVGSVAGLSQIFMNLLTNALDAVGSEGMIEIVASRLDRQLEISVTDNGVGISESVINRIWDPFFTTKDVGRGTGLGLYIVRNEVARFGGQILVQSKTGAGTTFLIKLPISEMQEKEIAA